MIDPSLALLQSSLTIVYFLLWTLRLHLRCWSGSFAVTGKLLYVRKNFVVGIADGQCFGKSKFIHWEGRDFNSAKSEIPVTDMRRENRWSEKKGAYLHLYTRISFQRKMIYLTTLCP